MILSETIGNYHQTIRIKPTPGENTLLIRINDETVFDGPALNIQDFGDSISFQDSLGKEYRIQKVQTISFI